MSEDVRVILKGDPDLFPWALARLALHHAEIKACGHAWGFANYATRASASIWPIKTGFSCYVTTPTNTPEPQKGPDQ